MEAAEGGAENSRGVANMGVMALVAIALDHLAE